MRRLALIANLTMKRGLFLTASFFASLFFILFASLVLGDCSGCEYNGSCYVIGGSETINSVSSYCDLSTKTFIPRKAEGSLCSNDFECTGGSCLNDNCTNIDALILQNQLLQAQLSYSGLDQYIQIGPCDVQPGCSAVASISNAHNVTKFCAAGDKCFVCNSGYSWNGTYCAPVACNYNPGCLNQSSLSHGYIFTAICNNGYNCFRCNSGYQWETDECVVSSDSDDEDDSDATGWYSYPVGAQEFVDGYSKELSVNQRFKIFVNGAYHYVGLKSLTSTTATIEVSSTPQTATLSVGSQQKFNIDADNFYDLKVGLNEIKGNKANITVSYNNDYVTTPAVSRPGANTVVVTRSGTLNVSNGRIVSFTKQPSNNAWIIIGAFVLIGLIVAIVAVVVYSAGKRRESQSQVHNISY
jgi:hypothetical protein